MTRVAGPDCAVMCNLINTRYTRTLSLSHAHSLSHTHTHTHTRHVGNGGELGGKRKKRRKERVGPVASNSDTLESNKEAGGENKVPRAQARIVQVESVCPFVASDQRFS